MRGDKETRRRAMGRHGEGRKGDKEKGDGATRRGATGRGATRRLGDKGNWGQCEGMQKLISVLVLSNSMRNLTN